MQRSFRLSVKRVNCDKTKAPRAKKVRKSTNSFPMSLKDLQRALSLSPTEAQKCKMTVIRTKSEEYSAITLKRSLGDRM